MVESRRTSPLLANPYTLSTTLLGATITPAAHTLDSVEKGVATDVSWTAHNDFGTVESTAKGGPLGSAKSSRDTIANHDVKEYTVEVPEGASRLDVSIGNTE